MKKAAPEFPRPDNSLAHGRVRNPKHNLCLDFTGNTERDGDVMRLTPCSSRSENLYWWLRRNGQLEGMLMCLDALQHQSGVPLQHFHCHGKGSQQFTYDAQSQELRHASSGTCLTVTEVKAAGRAKHAPTLEPCGGYGTQRWHFVMPEQVVPNFATELQAYVKTNTQRFERLY